MQPINYILIFISILSLLGTSRLSFAAPISTPHFQGPPRLILSRYSAHTNFHSVSTQAWTSNGQAFVAGDAGITHSVGSCESLLSMQQDFPLEKMIETNYITPAQAKTFSGIGTSLNSGQVNVLEIVHDATDAEIKKYYLKYPSERIGGTFTHLRDSSGTTPVKTSTAYSVGGQIWDFNQEGGRPVRLPWQLEDTRKNSKLDRNKYKYVWEWGRVAQDVPGEINSLYAANALLNYVDLKAHGGRLEDAYVMFHSFDKVNTRLYLRLHPNSIFPEDSKNPDDMLFLVPLSEMLEKYSASSFSDQVARLRSLSGGKIGEIAAIDLLIQNKLLRWDELDMTTSNGRTQKTPIILNDLSFGRIIYLDLVLSRFQMSAEINRTILKYFMTEINPLLHTYNTDGKYDNAADSVLTSYHYHQFNGIEISNLDPTLATEDSNYVLSTLFASYAYYLKRVSRSIVEFNGVSPEESYPAGVAALEKQEIKFGITTSSEIIAKQIKALNPSIVTFQPGTIGESSDNNDQRLVADHPFWFKDNQIFIFTIEQICDLARSHPQVLAHAIDKLKPGFWRSQYMLSQVDLF